MKNLFITGASAFAILYSGHASAVKPPQGGMYETGSTIERDGSGIKLVFTHEMRELPSQKTVAATTFADVDKRAIARSKGRSSPRCDA